MKIKFIVPLFALVLMLGLSNAAFAQLSCSVASTPVSRATETGLTEPAGDLIFNCVQGPIATTAATMTIDYGVPITNTVAYPANAVGPIRIANPSGTLAVAGQIPTISSVVNASNQIVINVPLQPGGAQLQGSFTLSGVLLGLNGTGKTSVSANVSVSPGNNVLITAQQNVATVITTVLAGLKPAADNHTPVLALTTATTVGTVLTSGTIQNNTTILPANLAAFSLSVTENYIDMFRSQAQFNGGNATNGVRLLYTFTGLATGVSLAGCSATVTSGTATVNGGATGTATSTAPTLVVEFTGTPSLTALDTVNLTCTTFTIGSTATLPLTPANIAATVTLAPVGTAFDSAGVPLTSGVAGSTSSVPRYAAATSAPVNVVSILSVTTHMLFPFVSIGNGFDTGFAIANTSLDPYGLANGGARPNNGSVTFYFYPAAGTVGPLVCTTASPAPTGQFTCAKGSGLSATGTVDAGRSWVVLGSELFSTITGAPASFNGYAFAIANFTNGHATVFVADAAFSGKFTAGGPALVLGNPNLAGNARTNLLESLGH